MLEKPTMPKKLTLKYWLMKSEPNVYSIDSLCNDKVTLWTGVRNYQARNFMMNDMKIGDPVFFYHSSAEPPGIAGLAEISSVAKPDPTVFDQKSEGYDPKATKEKPIWFCVEVKFVKKFDRLIPLSDLKSNKKLKDLLVLQRGQRLSIQPVTEKDFLCILNLSESLD